MGRAAELLRRSRKESGLTQAALARIARTTQSVISEYEQGRREPSFAAMDRLISAMGLAIEVSDSPPAARSMRSRVLSKAGELHAALDPLGARSIRLFGSVAREDDTDSSDIDLLVDTDASVGMFSLMHMRREAENVLGRPVDLVPLAGLKPEVVEEVEREAVLL
ncbi:helix-turn-helix domain-containing protein [Microbacterium sp. NIBRBAC000506063]|uniref:helix-turn-helix domain-containing protein n=1 Tax=Microbacterium sp. NIBRBAC000506063 TaxID=2734618 RepID=UPI001BB716B4|nr:XRE family transcriptional regulator [Microbacterium sp. NIBRBAC000506063]QTV80345.1 XRE family transcriptional regulator [Microbacterium sp. NIBRBAC000506063]